MSKPSTVSDSTAADRGARRLVSLLLAEDSPVHAVLLYGAPGAEQGAIARELAAGWLSPDPESPVRAAFMRGNAPDVLTIRPTGPSAIIRNGAIVPTPESEGVPLTHFFRTAPIAAIRKVAIIEDADRMNGDAANALLKPLEEPPGGGRLILTTTAIGAIPPTIVSRCLAVPCALAAADPGDEFGLLARGSREEAEAMNRRPEPHRRLVRLAESLRDAGPIAALAASTELRTIGEEFGSAYDLGARAGNARAVELLARIVATDDAFSPAWVRALVEAHRRILGNGAAALTLDATFTRLLTRRPREVSV